MRWNVDRTNDLIVVNGLVFDGESAELADAAVRIVDGRIVEVGGQAGPDSQVIDARGSVVLPGLIDAHFHAYGNSLSMSETEGRPLSFTALKGAQRLGAALWRGFTTVRDVAGGDRGLALAIEQGLLDSPRYFYTGAALSQTGGHGDSRSAEQLGCACDGQTCEVVDGVDDLRRAVRERLRTGAHAIKIMASGGVVSLTDPIRIPQYSVEEITAVCAEADRRGSYVAAHAYSPEAIRHAVGCGVRSVEHGNLLDAPTAAFLAERDAFLVPTLATYAAMAEYGGRVGMTPVQLAKNAEVLDNGREAIALAYAAGVPVGFGTDLMGDLESEQLSGLRLQAEASDVLATLRAATTVNAALLRRDDLGRIGIGAVGDLLIPGGNPFDDPAVLWTSGEHRVVIQGGRVVA